VGDGLPTSTFSVGATFRDGGLQAETSRQASGRQTRIRDVNDFMEHLLCATVTR